MNKEVEKNTKELVSVIIVSWNRPKDLKDTLSNLLVQQYEPLEIIVVDNNSKDKMAHMVCNDFPQVKLIELSKNIGIAAYNIGTKESKGEYLVLSDDDAYPEINSISLAVNKFRENSKLGIIAFKTTDFPLGLNLEKKYKKLNRYEETKKGIPVKIFCGCGVMIRREVIEKVGGYPYPEDFFWCGEESDIAMRAIHAGYEIRYYPELIFHHKLSQQNRSQSRRMYYETRNLIWLFWKYSPIIMALLKTIYIVIVMGLKSLVNGTFVYYFKGLVGGIKRLPVIMKQRQVVYTQTIRYAVMHNLLKKDDRKSGNKNG